MEALALIAAAAHAACPDPDAILADAEAALTQVRLDDARAKLREAEAAFACGPVATQEQLGRLWLIEGAALRFAGNPTEAGDSLAAAARVAPDLWYTWLGPDLRVAYEAARAGEPGDPGRIELDPAPVRYVAALDGRQVAFPADASAGLHLVQVGPDVDAMAFARILFLPAGQALEVATGLVEPEEAPPTVVARPPAPVAAPPAPEPLPAVPAPQPVAEKGGGHGSRALAIAGAVAAAGSGVGYLVGYTTKSSFVDPARTTEEKEKLEAQNHLGIGRGYALSAAAGGLVLSAFIHGKW